jgi:tetratricopeptide (TPR) repeat protein
MSGADARSAELYEQALSQLQCYSGDPLATIEQAIAHSPAFMMAHCLKAYLFLCGTEATQIPLAAETLNAAKRLAMNQREQQHFSAIQLLLHGHLDLAVHRLEDILIDHPRDVLALQVAHLFDFYRGDSRNLRDRPARVLRAWSEQDSGFHAVLGMYAFGLEECADYARAEAEGRRALGLNPYDSWAHHAVAHVYEMQGRQEEGIRWMSSRQPYWAENNFFTIHNWWHWALYHLDLDQVERALQLYDERIRGSHSEVMLDLIDASAMMWRLHLRGVHLGKRWADIAQRWEAHAEERFYAFNDFHAMMAFVGAQRWDLADRVLEAQAGALDKCNSNRAMTAQVGLPLSRAFYLFGRGEYGKSVELMRPIRSIAHRFGGSHAQRDIIDLTLIEAAARDGQHSLVDALVSERLALKPGNPVALRYREAALAA